METSERFMFVIATSSFCHMENMSGRIFNKIFSFYTSSILVSGPPRFYCARVRITPPSPPSFSPSDDGKRPFPFSLSTDPCPTGLITGRVGCHRRRRGNNFEPRGGITHSAAWKGITYFHGIKKVCLMARAAMVIASSCGF